MQLELSRFIESDLDDIAAYIAQDNPRRAVTFIREIRALSRFFPVICLLNRQNNVLPVRRGIQDGKCSSMENFHAKSLLFLHERAKGIDIDRPQLQL